MNRQRDYAITWVATFLFFVSFYALIVPLPRYLGSIGLADWQVGLILGASGVASLLIRPLSGLLIDAVGYKPTLLLGAIALTIGATGVVFTTSQPLLFTLRVFQALGYVIFTTAGNALVGQMSAAEERSARIAYFGLAANVAMTLTPGITDLALPYIGITPLFWMAGSIAVVAGVLTRFLRFSPVKIKTSEKYSFRRGRPPWRPDATVRHGGRTLRVPRSGLRGVDNRAAKWSALWRFPRQLWIAMWVAALFGAGFGAYFQYFAILLERRDLAAAPVYAAYGLSIIATRLLLGRYLDRIGLGRVLTAGALLMATGLVVAAFGTSTPLLILAAALLAIGGGFFHPMLIAHHVTLLPDRPGMAVACFYFGFDAGIGIGAWLLGLVLDLSGLTHLYLVASLLTLLTLLFIPTMIRQTLPTDAR